MGFSRQEFRSSLPFPPPVEGILSELSTMTHPSWVAIHGMAHSFIELDKAVVHVISLVIFQFTDKEKKKKWERGTFMGDGERYKSETRGKWSLKVCVCVNTFEFDTKDSEESKEESCECLSLLKGKNRGLRKKKKKESCYSLVTMWCQCCHETA